MSKLTLTKSPVATTPATVVFRADKSGDFAGEVSAVFHPLEGERDITCYAHVGQHGTATRGWYETTRAATEAESAPLKAELEGIGYDVTVAKRMRWL